MTSRVTASGGKPIRSGGTCPFGRGLAVLEVEVPLAAGRLRPIHEEAGASAHAAIERLHAQRAAVPGPGREVGAWAEETVIIADLHGYGGIGAPILHHRPDPPFAGLGHDDAVGLMTRDGPHQLAGEGAGIAGRIEADVIDGDAFRLQLGREVAHGGEQEGDLLLVMPDVGRLRPDLDHQDHVVLRVEVREAGDAAGELVAEHEAEGADGGQPLVRRAERPPSTPMICPVIQPASSETRKAARFAMSSGVPRR